MRAILGRARRTALGLPEIYLRWIIHTLSLIGQSPYFVIGSRHRPKCLDPLRPAALNVVPGSFLGTPGLTFLPEIIGCIDILYFANNRKRMVYPRYRAMGLQIVSDTIKSGCKHVIAHRLKQAGMRWSEQGAESVAKLRAA